MKIKQCNEIFFFTMTSFQQKFFVKMIEFCEVIGVLQEANKGMNKSIGRYWPVSRAIETPGGGFYKYIIFVSHIN